MSRKYNELIRLSKEGFSIFRKKGFEGLWKAVNKKYEMKKKINHTQNFNKFTSVQLNILESRLVWVLGSPRSGTTWLASRLLHHPTTVTWDEPFIGWHLDQNRYWQKNKPDYFFSETHKKNWLPYIKKLILVRSYSEAPDLTKTVIVKEPNGSRGADILMESLPKSKIIFLLRDGRDVIDSLIDAHKENSWHENLKPLLTQDMREEAIKNYSINWNKTIENVTEAYNHHSPKLRFFLKYENLRNDTFNELEKIYKFLNINITNIELKKIVENTSFEKVPKEKKGSGMFIRKAHPGGWKDNFSTKEINLMNSIMQENLKKQGYAV